MYGVNEIYYIAFCWLELLLDWIRGLMPQKMLFLMAHRRIVEETGSCPFFTMATATKRHEHNFSYLHLPSEEVHFFFSSVVSLLSGNVRKYYKNVFVQHLKITVFPSLHKIIAVLHHKYSKTKKSVGQIYL